MLFVFSTSKKHGVILYYKAIELPSCCYKFAFEGARKSMILQLVPEIEVDAAE
jgi:hypothetical protein